MTPVYPILDRGALLRADAAPESIAAMWQSLGLDLFQIRDKKSDQPTYERFCAVLKHLFPRMRIIANDFAALALDRRDIFCGVHLGQEDWKRLSHLEIESLKAAASDGFLVGLSTHNLAQFESALSMGISFSYIAIGPVRETRSKPEGHDPVVSSDDLFFAMKRAGEAGKRIVLIGGIDDRVFREVLSVLGPVREIPVPAVIQTALDRDSLQRLISSVTDARKIIDLPHA